MRTLFISALLFASAAVAFPAQAVRLVPPAALAQAGDATSPAPEGTDDESSDESDDAEGDDEEGDTQALPPGPSGTGMTAETPAAPSDAPTTAPAAPAVDAQAQQLVSGAPLFNPNVAVHIVEKKQFSDKGKHELALYPAITQVNGKFTQHFGTALSYTYHLHENFAFQLTPQFNWVNTESDFNQELVDKVREQAQAATSLLLNWNVVGGVEVTPIYGKFAFYEDQLAHYSLVVSGGAGYGSTRHQLKPKNDSGPATFGDTGNRFVGSVGGGFRVLLGNRFAIRLEVRDIVYTARVDRVNGCDFNDLDAMDKSLRAGKPVTAANVSDGCQVAEFDGTDSNNHNRSTDVPLALALVRDPTSDVLNLVSFYGGVSFIF
ncbi:MAG: outer membrane beta-barrel domain-containing protein [Myxococcaceae bacterium]|nr:outer membrane beta-barrel domain-containing protein [Myxococcaceae bacterium]